MVRNQVPVWLIGVALYRWRIVLPAVLAWPCVIAPMAIYLIAHRLNLQAYTQWVDHRLPFDPFWSSNFVWQYLLGILVSINLIGFRCLRDANWILPFERPIRALAARTLSIYLYHIPLIYFYAAVLPRPLNPVLRGVAIVVATLVSIGLLSRVTEARKSQWREGLLAGTVVICTISRRMMRRASVNRR